MVAVASREARRPWSLEGRGRRLALSFVILVVAWEVGSLLMAGSGDRTAATKLPAPHLVLRAFVEQAPTLLQAAWATARGALLGLAVGTLVGFLLALLMSQARWIEEAGYPYVVAAQMIPTIALAPIVLSAVRDADATRVVVAAYVTMFSVSLGTIRGLKSTPPAALELMRTIDARRWETYRKVRIPAALPFFFAGLKVAAPLAVVGEIVVELAGSKDGLGTLLLTTQYYGPSYAYLFWAALLTTMALGYLFAWTAGLVERIVAPWQPELRGA
jgi:NitT/TauT family transport system permease protein